MEIFRRPDQLRKMPSGPIPNRRHRLDIQGQYEHLDCLLGLYWTELTLLNGF